MKNTLLVFALFFLSTAANAQAYRCNVGGKMVIQDIPCGGALPRDNTSQAATTNYAANDGGPIEAGKSLCREQGPQRIAWKDPESIRVGSVYGGKMTVVDLGGVKTGGRQFFVEVNAKNSYGGYVGNKSLICYTSQDGNRIIKIDDLLIH